MANFYTKIQSLTHDENEILESCWSSYVNEDCYQDFVRRFGIKPHESYWRVCTINYTNLKGKNRIQMLPSKIVTRWQSMCSNGYFKFLEDREVTS